MFSAASWPNHGANSALVSSRDFPGAQNGCMRNMGPLARGMMNQYA